MEGQARSEDERLPMSLVSPTDGRRSVAYRQLKAVAPALTTTAIVQVDRSFEAPNRGPQTDFGGAVSADDMKRSPRDRMRTCVKWVDDPPRL